MADMLDTLAALPAPDAAHGLACAQLQRTAEVAARLAQDDDDALHDFRVALRRLRSLLRLWRVELRGTVRRRHRRKLREFSQRTNDARDAEVQLSWLKRSLPLLRPAERGGARWLAAHIERRLEPDQREARAQTAKAFAKTAAKLAPRLDGGRI